MGWNRYVVPRLVPRSFSGVGSSWAAKSEVGGARRAAAIFFFVRASASQKKFFCPEPAGGPCCGRPAWTGLIGH